jgi:hypothetical protein
MRRPLGVAALLFLVACTESTRPSETTDPRTGTDGVSPTSAPVSIDDEFMRAARTDVPGFAGYYIREDGRLIIQTVRADQAIAAENFVRTLRANRTPIRGVPIINIVKYDFAQLSAWADAILPALDSPGAVMIDIDEVANKVRIGVLSPRAARQVRAAARKVGLPPDALMVEVTTKPELRLTLKDRAPSMEGGFLIRLEPNGATCTLGFNAMWNGRRIFVTASHCSSMPFGYGSDGSPQYQPGRGEADLIGREVNDIFQTCGHFCRNSDASYYEYLPGIPVKFGYIANVSTGTTINPTQPHLRIARRLLDSEVAVGDSLTKVGQNSGLTRGRVTQTCVNLNHPYGYVRCSYISTIRSGGGDSGSPIFEQVGTDARLHGLLWGGPAGNPDITYHSRLSGIESDLGAILVCSLATPCFGPALAADRDHAARARPVAAAVSGARPHARHPTASGRVTAER